jgi:hypothetical protein
MKAVLSPPGSGCLPGVPGLAPPAQQGVLALRASCLSLLICDARAGLTLVEEECDQEELHIDILSPQQALLARSQPRTLAGCTISQLTEQLAQDRACLLRSVSHPTKVLLAALHSHACTLCRLRRFVKWLRGARWRTHALRRRPGCPREPWTQLQLSKGVQRLRTSGSRMRQAPPRC